MKTTKKALAKMTAKEIFKNKGRFFSLLAIIVLGVAFFVGISQSGPDMTISINQYFKKQKLADGSLVSSIGFEKGDLEKIKNIKGIHTLIPLKSKTVEQKNSNQVIKLIEKNDEVNLPVLVSGRLPKNKNEIALDDRAKKLQNVQLGKTLELKLSKTDAKDLSTTQFKVVGFVHLPQYIERNNRETTNVGKGTVDYFGIVLPKVLKTSLFTELDFFIQKEFEDAYSDAYKKEVSSVAQSLKKKVEEVETERFQALVTDKKNELKTQEEKVSQGLKQISVQAESFQQQEIQLNVAKDQFMQVPEAMRPIAQVKTLEENEKKIQDGKDKLAKEKKKLLEAKEEITKGKQTLKNQSTPSIYTFTRSDNSGYLEYHENAKRLGEIATVFPVFFFLIACLICFTTMARMVNENRMELGTLKSLGYTKNDIAQKYIVYCIVISSIGTALGVLIGSILFPTVIFNAYQSMYNVTDFEPRFFAGYAILSFLASLVCSLGAAMLVLRVDLHEMPSRLLQMKAPKSGKRIFLERLTFLWKHLSFLQKVALRNLFRYKGRMIMVVLGVAGCMAMIVTGFGLRDSISDIPTVQFSQINHYQAMVAVQKLNSSIENEINQSDYVQESTPFLIQSMSVKKSGKPSQTVSVSVPKDTKTFTDFVTLRNRKTQKTMQLKDGGIYISEKLAKLFNKKTGEKLEITSPSKEKVSAKILGVFENYTGHVLYLTPKTYKNTFHTTIAWNMIFVKENPKSDVNTDAVATQWMKNKDILNVTFTSKVSSLLSDTLDSLNVVMWIMVLSAGLLAFVVLYNLTNINIAERSRELSTIKVLGFYDEEVTIYLYRENILLSIFGILVGCGLGKILHSFVLQTAEVDNMMFRPTIHIESFLISAFLTLLFSILVMAIMHFKLKKVDMIAALKAME